LKRLIRSVAAAVEASDCPKVERWTEGILSGTAGEYRLGPIRLRNWIQVIHGGQMHTSIGDVTDLEGCVSCQLLLHGHIPLPGVWSYCPRVLPIVGRG